MKQLPVQNKKALYPLPSIFLIGVVLLGCEDGPRQPINQKTMERDCPQSGFWDPVHETAVPASIKACLAATSFCQDPKNINNAIPAEVISTCDPVNYPPSSGATTPPNGGSQAGKRIDVVVEIINYAASFSSTAIQSELASKNAGPQKMFKTLSTQGTSGINLTIPAKPSYNVSINKMTTSWASQGATQALPPRNNECGSPVTGSFLHRITKTIDRNRNVRYEYPQGENGSLWGYYLMTDNQRTKSYNQSYSDGASSNYHISIVAIDAINGIEEIDESATTPSCNERFVGGNDIAAIGFPQNVNLSEIAKASDDYHFGTTVMRSHPIFIDIGAINEVLNDCPGTSISEIFDYFTSHEVGHFFLDAYGHNASKNDIMSQRFSCAAIKLGYQKLPYTSATVPEPPARLSKYLVEEELNGFCTEDPRSCKTISGFTEQKARIVYPAEDFKLRWTP